MYEHQLSSPQWEEGRAADVVMRDCGPVQRRRSIAAAATIRSFETSTNVGDAATDVMTSAAFVIGLALVIVLGLARNTQLSKVAFPGFPGRLRCSRGRCR